MKLNIYLAICSKMNINVNGNPYDKYNFDNLIQRQHKEYENGYIEAKGIDFKNDLDKLDSERYIL